jgi:hypothetical protein
LAEGVILYYLSLSTPLKTPKNGSFTLLRVVFVLRFVLRLAVAIQLITSFADHSQGTHNHPDIPRRHHSSTIDSLNELIH